MYFPQAVFFSCLINLVSSANIPRSQTKGPKSAPQLSTHPIHEFPYPTWVENNRVRDNDQILVSLVTKPYVYIIDPFAASTNPISNTTGLKLLHDFSPSTAILGITEVKKDQFYFVVSDFSLTAKTITPGTCSIWNIDLNRYDLNGNTTVTAREIAPFPKAGLLNGMDTLDASQNLVVIADSTIGVVWLLNVETGENRVFLNETEMQPPKAAGVSTIGINGLKVLHEGDTAWIYFSNTDNHLVCRVPVSMSRLQKTGPVEILLNGSSIDDMALDPKRGMAYLAAGSENSLLGMPLTGGKAITLVGGLNDTLLPGPTSAALGRGVSECGKLFVTTDGGILDKVNGDYSEGGKVLEVDLDAFAW
ncbi:hypothetical protein G7Y89_g10278 [Cudoniella acicularis]|uniref:SMP-30/Gluconolactonase/LRE-like region domain-containing protein n=1 Tax=Cudoniella acicularis TaxID=354080 RepID=A0A8H4RD30_9HELO|nr:hypothetical protein G7Y89_g10278 [Cudoniella acicularis]